MPGKAKGLSSVNSQKKQLLLNWYPLSPSAARAEGAQDFPGPWFLPTVVAPTRAQPQLRSARRAPPAAAREWSSPSVAATPLGSDSCSSCWGSSARA